MTISLTPLEPLFEADIEQGADLPLPPDLANLYGRLHFPSSRGQPHVIANFVSTLDGVVSLNVSGQAGGGPISGNSQHDRMVMGLLRASADSVIVGAGTLRASHNHVWTAEYVYPSLSEPFKILRTKMGKATTPLNVIVTATGRINFDMRVFQSGEVQVLVITTPEGERRIRGFEIPPNLQMKVVEGAGSISAGTILDVVNAVQSNHLILVEGGPRLMGDFFAEACLSELFLTLSPQIAGRDDMTERPGLVAGRTFAPDCPLWSKLISVKRGGDHLFLRYSLAGVPSTRLPSRG